MIGYAKNISETTRRDADLSDPDLWLRYFELGGMSTPEELRSYLRRGVVPSAHERDVLAHALNERFSELGRSNHPVRYAGGPPMIGSPSRSLPLGVIQLRLLGSFSLRIDTQVVRLPMSAQRLVAFLALHDGSLLRQHVAGSLWGETTDRRAAGSLRSALWRLGRPTHPLVEVVDGHLRLSPTVAVDVRASQALAHRILDPAREPTESDLDEALLSEDLLPDWSEDWVLAKREHHAQLRLRALEALCRRLSEMGRFGHAVQAGLLAVSGEPLRESSRRTLIAAHIAEGNAAAALEQGDSFRTLLRDELDLEPSAEMQALAEGLHR
ncbi:MAG TPA: BTAD domain-containing putative transcriptional regulator [Actinomycetota bacterium]